MYQAQTFSALIQSHAPGLVVLAQIRAYERQNTWVKSGGLSITYQVPIVQYPKAHGPRTIDTVRVGDPASAILTPVYESGSNTVVTNQVVPYNLTVQASSAAVDANPGSFFHDINGTGYLYVSLPTSASPIPTFIYCGFLIYVSPGSFDGGAMQDTTGNIYWPYLQSVPEIRRGVSSPYFGTLQQGTGKLSLLAGTGLLDQLFRQYTWAHGDVTIFLGGDSLPFSQYQQFSIGTIEKAHWDENSIIFDVVDPTQQLLLNFPQTLFTAADATQKIAFVDPFTSPPIISNAIAPIDIEATAATTRIPVGKPKPVAYGYLKHVQPVQMAMTVSGSAAFKHSMWCLAHHPCQGIDSVTIGNVTASTGNWDVTGAFQVFASTDNSIIWIQGHSNFDATQTPYVTFRGKMNADGSLMANPADIVQDIITVEGPGQAYPLDQTILAQSRFMCDIYNVGRYYSPSNGSAPMRIIDALDQWCRDTLSYFYLTMANKYAFRTWWPSVASQQTMDEAWGDFLSSQIDSDATQLYQSLFVEYGEDPLLWTILFSSYYTSQLPVKIPPPLQKGPSNFSFVSINRPECAAVVLNRSVTKTMKGTLLYDQGSAWVLGNRFARFSQAAADTLTVKTKIRLMLWDLFQGFVATKARFPQDPANPTNWEVMETIREFRQFTLSVKADNCRVIGSQCFFAADCTVPWSSMTATQKLTVGVVTDDNGYALNTDPASYGSNRLY